MLKIVHHVHKVTGQDNLCLAGGVGLNCVANGRILQQGPFKNIWVQPASGDAGGALGAALFVWYKYLGNKRFTDGVSDFQKASLLGTSYDDDCIEHFLIKEQIPYKKLDNFDLPDMISELLIKENIIGWFQGNMEFGPRALGCRSIIADPRSPSMQSKMNLKIKYRESFRPLAPSVLAEAASEWFDLDKPSPYMLLVAQVLAKRRVEENFSGGKFIGFDKLKITRSLIPAVTHVDYSARLQTVEQRDNPLYYGLIKSFYNKTGCPVIINTSFNVRGEPLVCTPQDAFRCFMRTEMDYLVMGRFLLDKKEQKSPKNDITRQQIFELD